MQYQGENTYKVHCGDTLILEQEDGKELYIFVYPNAIFVKASKFGTTLVRGDDSGFAISLRAVDKEE